MSYACCCHFVSFYSQSMIEITVTLHNAVARKRYLTIQSNTFTVDIDGFQTDWHLICMSNALMLNAQSIIDNVNTYIEATLQWTKVSYATLLITFYCYFASDAWKCINYCTHCRKLKGIHYYSCNFRLFTLYYKSDSICKTFTTYSRHDHYWFILF